MLVLPGAVSGCARAAAPIELVEQVKEAAGSYVEASPAAPVEVRVRVQPEHANQAARYQSAARATVLAYGRRFQTMPFTSITVVDPGWRGHNSSSSNGPSATIFAPARWLAPGLTVETERTVVHEPGLRFRRHVTKYHSPENWFIEGINRYTSMPVVAP